MIKPLTFPVLALSFLALGCGGASSDGAGSGTGGSTHNGTGGSGSGGDGSAPEASCDAFTPCGGNVVGRWRLMASCPAEVPVACTGYTDGFSYSGDATYVFGADGTLSLEGAATMTWDLRMTDACAVELGADDAAAYCEIMQAPEAEPEADVECTTSTNLCECHVVQGPFEYDLTPAPYQTSGTDLILGEDALGYCVDGDTLRLGLNGTTTTYLVRE